MRIFRLKILRSSHMAVMQIIAVNSKSLKKKKKMFLMPGFILIILIEINIFTHLCFSDPDLIYLRLDA